MTEAFEPFDRKDLLFVVLTLDGDEHRKAVESATNLGAVYRGLRRTVERWMKRARRQLTKMGMRAFGSEWCATVEAHRSDVPHVNLLIACPDWARWVAERYEAKRIAGLSHREATLLDEPFSSHLEPCGLGVRSTAEVPRGKDSVSGYITKLASRADVHGEMAKKSQLPLKAPKGFRRLRSGRRFLPARRKNPDVSGTIVRRVWTESGDEEVRPLVQSSNHEYMAIVDAVCELEQKLAWRDEEERARARRLRKWGVPTIRTRDERTTAHTLDLKREPPDRPPTRRGAPPTGGAAPGPD